MLMSFLLTFVFSFCFLVFFMISPMSLGMLVLVLCLFCSLVMSFFFSSWFGYILFLIYVGGMLVMFCYVCALSPNTSFISFPFWTILFSLVIFFFPIFFKMSISFGIDSIINFHSLNMNPSMLSNSENKELIVLLGFILLFALFSVVKICYFSFFAFRKLVS